MSKILVKTKKSNTKLSGWRDGSSGGGGEPERKIEEGDDLFLFVSEGYMPVLSALGEVVCGRNLEFEEKIIQLTVEK